MRLQCLRELQGVTAPLVVDHGCLVNLREPVVSDTGQGSAIDPDLDAPVWVLEHDQVKIVFRTQRRCASKVLLGTLPNRPLKSAMKWGA